MKTFLTIASGTVTFGVGLIVTAFGILCVKGLKDYDPSEHNRKEERTEE